MELLNFRNFFLLVILIFSSLILTSCGGGGGGGGGGGNNGVSINTSSINFSAERSGTLPATQTLSISWDNPDVAGVLVGVPPGNSIPSWLDLSLLGSSSPLTLNVAVNTTDLAGGLYPMTLRVVSGDASGDLINIVDIPLLYTVTEGLSSSSNSLSYSYAQGSSTLPPNQSVSLSGPGISWNASVSETWVNLGETSGMTPAAVDVGIDIESLAAGDYSAVITFTNAADPSDIVTIDVSLQVSTPAIELSGSSLSFSGVNGAALMEQTVSFGLNNQNNTAWTASVSDPWITLDTTSWTSPDTVNVGIDATSTSLTSGSYSGAVTFSTTYLGNNLNMVIPVNLTLTQPSLSVSSGSLNFEGGTINDLIPQVISFSVNTGTSTYPWTINLDTNTGSGWLEASVLSGMVSQSQETSSIIINPGGQPGAIYTGNVELQVTVNGDILTQSFPVELQLTPHRLFVADNGVAFLSTPSISKLSHIVTVNDNLQLNTPWTAASDQSWLTVTSSGITNSELVLTADPSSLSPETIHYANVVINSSDTSIVNSGQEVIKVGFYVTNSSPVTQPEITVPAFGRNDTPTIIADPIRPYVYVTNNRPGIEVYNIYTGLLVTTISDAGTSLLNIIISSNGDMLYAQDHSDGSIVSVDLTNPILTANLAWENTGLYRSLKYTRINGRPVLIGGARDIIDANTGVRLFPSDTIFGNSVVTSITQNGSIMYSANTNTSSHTVSRYSLNYNELDDEFSITQTNSSTKLGINRGISTNPEGNRVYRSCWYPNSEVEVYDGNNLATLAFVSSGTNGGALSGPDGLVYCARYYSELSALGVPDVWSIDPSDNSVVSEFNVSGEIAAQMFIISGDGKRLITRSNNQATLTMTTIP